MEWIKWNLHISLCSLIWSFRADIALIGLAVMGQNLILNMNDHGFVVSHRDTLFSHGFLVCISLSAGDWPVSKIPESLEPTSLYVCPACGCL